MLLRYNLIFHINNKLLSLKIVFLYTCRFFEKITVLKYEMYMFSFKLVDNRVLNIRFYRTITWPDTARA